eukprot:1136724-Rhodomonas_salina.1
MPDTQFECRVVGPTRHVTVGVGAGVAGAAGLHARLCRRQTAFPLPPQMICVAVYAMEPGEVEFRREGGESKGEERRIS